MLRSNDSEAQRRGWHVATAAVVLLANMVWPGDAGAIDSRSPGAEITPGRVAAGAVNAIVIDPQSPMTLYAASECAGVLKSTNGGESWVAAKGEPFSVNALATAAIPTRPTAARARAPSAATA